MSSDSGNPGESKSAGGTASPQIVLTHQSRRLRRVRLILICLVAAAAAVGGYYLAMRFALTNFHAVVPGQVYRSAQPSPGQIEQWCGRYGLKTVVNLRADAAKTGLDEERSAAGRAGAQVVNIRLSDRRLPEKAELLQLIDVLENAPRPILLHCKAGADRSGVAAVLAAMAVGGRDYQSARAELSIAYLHVDWRASSIGGLLDLFEDYCRENAIPAPGWPEFRKWAADIYRPPDTAPAE
ncbi:MAG: tyrosine-protein phosphatase [Planctomycetes bacterium]|nr:tyrosine-protein phosphatase [Planctomycetota bacterium]